MDNVNKIIQSSFLYQSLRFFYRKLSKRNILAIQVPYRNAKYRIFRLGSAYGGWHFVKTDTIYNSLFISGGLEEDVSFEIEFIHRFNAKGYLYDPTPLSEKHMEIILNNLGSKRKSNYSSSGIQGITSYRLNKVNGDQITYSPKALSNTCELIRFYAPENKAHQSYSAIYSNKRNEYIEVEATTIDQELKNYGLERNNIELIKLDIEGAELNVIENMIEFKIRPRQLLIEFDDLNRLEELDESRIKKLESLYNKILKNYVLIYSDGVSNFSFLLKEVK